MSMHQFVPKFANENKCNDCHENKSVHETSVVKILHNLSGNLREANNQDDYAESIKEASKAIEHLITEGYKKGYIDGSIKELTAKIIN